MKNIKAGIFGFIASFIISTSIADAQSPGGYSCFGPWGMMSGFSADSMIFFGLIFWVLLIAALVLFIAWLLKQLQTPKRRK